MSKHLLDRFATKTEDSVGTVLDLHLIICPPTLVVLFHWHRYLPAEEVAAKAAAASVAVNGRGAWSSVGGVSGSTLAKHHYS